jgi:hypothetical protein
MKITKLIATLGMGAYSPADYYLESDPLRTCRTCYSPAATAELAGPVKEAILLLTREAEAKHWHSIREELEGKGVAPQKIEIPLGHTEEEIGRIFSLLNRSIEKGSELVIDITYAFRHLPVLMLASLAYLKGEREVRIRGIYYGAWEARSDDRVPVFDLTPFFTLTDCYHAIRQFRETGDARSLARYLTELNSSLWRKKEESENLTRLASHLTKLGAALVTPLPLEAGMHAAKALSQLSPAVPHVGKHSTVGQSLIEAISPTLQALAVQPAAQEKRALGLTLEELKRQMAAIRFALQAQAYDRALIQLREWVISRCLLAENRMADWLDYKNVRDYTEHKLNSAVIRIRQAESQVPEPQRKLTSLWQMIAERRNKFAHAGMNGDDEINPEAEAVTIRELVHQCEDRMGNDELWRLDIPGAKGELLITPLGLSPGVLFTALSLLRPENAVVITSSTAAGQIPEICRNASFDSSRIHLRIAEDPHKCFGMGGPIAQSLTSEILKAGRVTLNVTGGTTALQYIVERVGRNAERLGAVVRRVALVDRRPLAEQQQEPYVCGEIVDLDGAPAE